MVDETPVSRSMKERVRSIVPSDKYFNITEQTAFEGSAKHTYTAEHGRDSDREVVLKTDREPYDAFTCALKEKGKGTKHELEILLGFDVEDALARHVSPLLDYFEGEELTVLVEKRFSGGGSALQHIREHGALEADHWAQFMDQLLTAESYYASKGFVHRDPNLSNTMIRFGPDGLEMRLTDPGNARRIDHQRDASGGYVGSTAARSITDPLSMNGFDDCLQNEVFMVAMDGLIAATGDKVLHVDPITGEAYNAYTGESVLNWDGTLNIDKAGEALEMGLKCLPKALRKYEPMLRAGLALDTEQRYRDFAQFRHDFDQASRPGLADRLKRNWRSLATGAVATAVTLGGLATWLGIDMANRHADTLTELVTEATRYEVSAEWDGEGLEVKNNLVTLAVNASAYNGTHLYYPKHPYLKVQPGEEISVTVSAHEIPRPLIPGENSVRTPTLAGRAYIEGVPLVFEMVNDEYDQETGEWTQKLECSNDFWVYPYTPDGTDQYHQFGGYGSGRERLMAPEDLPDGVYVIAVELYEPLQERINVGGQRFDTVKFNNPGRIMNRKRVPIIVGDVDHAIEMRYLKIGSFEPPSVGFVLIDDLDKTFLGSSEAYRGVDFHYRVPEEDYRYERIVGERDWRIAPWLPREKDNTGRVLSTDTRTLEIVAAIPEGPEIFQTYLPIERALQYTTVDGKKHYEWDFALPGKEWSERLASYRAQRLNRSIIATSGGDDR